MRKMWFGLVCAFASSASAQIGDYLGPGVLSRGAGTIGRRGGEQVDLRFFVDVSGVYDNGLQPYSLDSKGNLVQIDGLYGVEAAFGLYGTHRWRRANLGLDYRGSVYHYSNNSYFDGTDHNLALGYTYQKSRRLSFDLRQVAGTSSRGYASAGNLYGANVFLASTDVVNQPTTLLFDNRVYYIQSTMDVNFLQSARTIYTFGGDGYTVRRQARGLTGMNGYNLRGRVEHRLSKNRTVGASYSHTHYDFPRAFGESDIHTAEASFDAALGRRWTFSLTAGAFIAEVQGLQRVALDPVIAALLGQTSTTQTFYRKITYPSGSANLVGQLSKSSSVRFSYLRTVSPGNGVYLTSRAQSANGNYSYTGIHKWNLGVSAGYSTLSGIGQEIRPYSQFSGGAGFTYELTRAFHIIGRYDARHQEIDLAGYRRTSYRATIGLGFSPGSVPLSLW